jgi:hypothetical protein
MTIQFVRVANLILVAIIIASGHLYCLWYIGAMHLSLEILNRKKIYLQHHYKIYNTIFWVYQLVLIERLFKHQFSTAFERLLNCAEHLGFGIIICLKIYIYTAVFGKRHSLSRWKRGMIAFSLFNIIGLLNEVFQSILTNRSLFGFTNDSIKDIKMNLLGGFIFLLGVGIRVYWMIRKIH